MQASSSKPAATTSAKKQKRRISFRTFLVLGVLTIALFFLARPGILYTPTSEFDLIFEEIAPSITRADLREATDGINAALQELLTELKAHVSDVSGHTSEETKGDSILVKRQLFPNPFSGLFGGNKGNGGDQAGGGGAVGGTDSDSGGGSGLFSGLLGGGGGAVGSAAGSDRPIGALAKPLANAMGAMVADGAQGKGPLGAILGGITKALNPAANALGAGVGEGAIKGLRLESMMKAQTTANKNQDSGIAGLAKNLGEGASEAIFSNIDISKLAPSGDTVALAANSLGSGLGNGTASGLNLSQSVAAPDPSQTGVPALAGNLGFGLTGGLFGNLDTKALMSGPMSQGLMKTLAAIPAPAGKGLGEGAAAGLKLPGTDPNTAVLATDPNGSNVSVSSASEDFTRSLAASFLGKVDFQQLAGGQTQNIMKQLAKIPGPAGKGLGEGAAQGLKLAAPPKVKRVDGGNVTTEQISEDFTRNLASSFLGSVDVKSFANSDQTAGLMKTLAQIPGPAGRGLGQGAAIGLKLAKQDSVPAADGSGTFDAGVASESFTRELASSFLGNSNIQGQVNQQQLLQTVAQVAPAVGQGLGRGAAAGLKKQGAPSAPPPPAPPSKVISGKRQASPSAGTPDIPGIAGDFSQNLAQSFVGNVDVSQFGGPDQQKQLLDTISKAAPFAGSGLGQGAAEGLGLTGKPPADAKGVVRRQDPGQGESSVGIIAQGFTRSLSSSFLSNANISSLASKAAAQGSAMIGPAVQGFASGLGGGAATGLGLQKDVQEPIDDQNIGSVLKGFSRSLTTSFLANGTLQNIQKKAADTGGSLPILPAAQGLAKGFGNGAASAFGFQEADILDSKASDIPTVAQGFSGSLTQSFLANGTAQKLTSMVGNQDPTMLGPIAEGLGKGFGGGAAESLGFQSAAAPSNASDAPAVAQGFSRALTTSFLANGTLSKISQKAMAAGGGLTKSIDISKAAEGLGIGIIDGGSTVIFTQTGMGNTSLATNSQAFNDTIGGAATGFGRGISGEAVKAVFMAFGNKSITDKLAGTLGTGSEPLVNTPTPSASPANKRALDASATKTVKRQAQLNTTDAINAFVQNLNLTTINTLVQKGADALGCTGVGGLIQVGSGLQQNAPKNTSPNLSSSLKNLPLSAPLNITSNGFLFQIDLQHLSLTVNGLPAQQLTALIIAHVAAVAAAFYFLLPAALALDAARDLALLLNRPNRLAFAPATTSALHAVVPVLGAVGAGLGAAAAGSAAHFRTPHQITGWITLALGVAGAVLHFVAGRVPGNRKVRRARDGVAQAVLGLAQLELLLGWRDANAISFCLTQGIPVQMAFAGGAALTGVVFVGLGAVGLRWVVGRWVVERERGGVGDGKEEGGGRDPRSRFST